jgi:hypothetical protein
LELKESETAYQVTVCVCPTYQTVVAVGLVIGGETTSLDTRGKAQTENSKDVKSRTYRMNMMISLDCLVVSQRERKPFESSEELHRSKKRSDP